MTPTYRLTPQAVDNLDELAAYIARDKPAVALRFLESAEKTFHSLAGAPESGAVVPTKRPELQRLRLWHVSGFPNHLFLYRIIAGGVEIIRVFHGSRDWQALL